MKKILFLLAIIGMITLVSCGAQENCRGRVSNDNIIKASKTTVLTLNYSDFTRK